MSHSLTAFNHRIPPQSLESEQATLGAMLIDRAAIEKAAEILRAEEFYRDAHRVIFEAILALVARDEPVDLLTVQEQLKLQGMLEQVRGAPYLITLTEAVPTAANVEYYAKIVQEKAILRRLIDASVQIQGLAHSEYEDIGDVVDRAETLLKAVSEVRETYDDLPISRGTKDMSAEPIEALFWGIFRGKVTLLNGQSGMGKSTFALNLAWSLTSNRQFLNFPPIGRPLRVLYVDAENGPNLVRQKLELLGTTTEDFFYLDARGTNFKNLRRLRKLEEYCKHHEIDLVIFDTLSSLFPVEDENANHEGSRQMETIANFARRTDAAVLVIHHLGKNVHDKFGRGASSRGCVSDVTMNLLGRCEDDEEDVTLGSAPSRVERLIRFQIVKDRICGQEKGSLYLKAVGDGRFELSTPSEWRKKALGSELSSVERAQVIILDQLTAHGATSRKDLISDLETKGIGENATDRALKALLDEQRIKKSKIGRGGANVYELS
jgi:RecA/RadA recombinase